MGDSGSALMLGEKCVITEAPKTDTKIDQKWCQQQKSDKNWQKSTKQKNSKKWKSEKVTKSENHKIIKMTKCKIRKV